MGRGPDKLPFEMKGVVIPSFLGLLRGFIGLLSLGLSNDAG